MNQNINIMNKCFMNLEALWGYKPVSVTHDNTLTPSRDVSHLQS